MKSIFVIIAILFSIQANAVIGIYCQSPNKDLDVAILLKKNLADVQVIKSGKILFESTGFASYNELWNSITLDATVNTELGLDGIKVYFEYARNVSSAIRPYGATTQKLFPGTEGITVQGIHCNQKFEDIKQEIKR